MTRMYGGFYTQDKAYSRDKNLPVPLSSRTLFFLEVADLTDLHRKHDFPEK